MSLSRPDACRGCVLDTHPQTQGFIPPVGPTNAPLLFLSEAGGEEEARTGIPFQGAAGGMLNRLLGRLQMDRGQIRIVNALSCRPPNNWLDGAPYQHAAITHCARHREPVLAEGHPVVVALGAIALKTLLGVWGTGKGYRIEDWHACVTRDPTDRFWIVPTFHPSYLQRGATHLFGCVAYDLQVAQRVSREGRPADPAVVVVDPPVEWFRWWADQVVQAVARDRDSVWLAVDIETPDKSDGQDEGELSSEDRSYVIVRVNLSVHPDEGVTVPYQGPYIALIDRLLALANPKCVWSDYDEPRLRAAGHTFGSAPWDFMWAWHHLQSDLPRGLGFVAPFYSGYGAWKHLASSQPGEYAAIDGFQTLRNAFGIARDLEASGMWDCFARHTHAVHRLALKPAQEMGVRISRERLVVFIADLEVKQRRLLHAMQGMVPEAVRPLTPKGGLKRPPAEGAVHVKGREVNKDGSQKKDPPDPVKQDLYAQVATVVHHVVRTLAQCCDTCGAPDVGPKHRCDGGAVTTLREVDVDRWFWQEPFNPDSPDQILAYLKLKGHKPGRAKKTGHDSTDRETLNRLYRETGDPLYKAILDSRGVGKVKGTYGVGTLKRLDGEDRVHPTPTFKPSTGRLSYVNPNITNVITDRQAEVGKENLAAGFRRCVVAGEVDPLWAVDGWAARYDG